MESIKDELMALVQGHQCYDGCQEGTHCEYWGSIFNLVPSGKYYLPWCTNASEDEMEADEGWWAAAEEAAEDLGLWITLGEGDPTDVYVCWE